jgi:hypothetical protein
LLLIRRQEGDEIKIKIRSKIKRGTQKREMHPGQFQVPAGDSPAGTGGSPVPPNAMRGGAAFLVVADSDKNGFNVLLMAKLAVVVDALAADDGHGADLGDFRPPGKRLFIK